MKLVLTGATGFIGSHLLAELAGRHEIVALARRRPSREIEPLAEWVEHDMTRALDRSVLPERVDAVVHLAQSAQYREFPEGAADTFALNVQTTFELLEYARGAGASSFVFTSTGGVRVHPDPGAEAKALPSLNFYLGSKYAAEVIIASYRQLLSTVVLRPFFVYGPGQRNMLVPRLAEQVLLGKPVTVEGPRGMRVNPIHVSDAVRAFEPALELGRSGLFDIAGDDVVTITELVQLLGDVSGREPEIRHEGNEPAGDLVGDNTQMKDVLGVQPQISLRRGLEEVVSSAQPPSQAASTSSAQR